MKQKSKMIQVSEKNYHLLRNLGSMTDSFDAVVTQVLEIALPLFEQKRRQRKEDELQSLGLIQSHLPSSETISQPGRWSPN